MKVDSILNITFKLGIVIILMHSLEPRSLIA